MLRFCSFPSVESRNKKTVWVPPVDPVQDDATCSERWFEAVRGQRKAEPVCRVCWLDVLTACGLISAGPERCFSVPDWSPEVFDLASLAVCSGCFWDTNWPALRRMHFLSLLCRRPPHISLRHLQTVTLNLSLTACPSWNEGALFPHSPFHVCCVISAPVQRLLCVSKRLPRSREVADITNITLAAAKCTAHSDVIDLPLMCWSIMLLRAMRSPCRAPQNSNGNLCAQERVDVSPEHKKNHSHKNKIEEIKPETYFLKVHFHFLSTVSPF